jgi:hypothetical protein
VLAVTDIWDEHCAFSIFGVFGGFFVHYGFFVHFGSSPERGEACHMVMVYMIALPREEQR